MRKIVILLFSFLTFVGCNPSSDSKNPENRDGKTNGRIEVLYDSKNRPHKVVVYRIYSYGISAVDLDASTYISTCQEKK